LLQQWLRERTTVLCQTYVTYLVSACEHGRQVPCINACTQTSVSLMDYMIQATVCVEPDCNLAALCNWQISGSLFTLACRRYCRGIGLVSCNCLERADRAMLPSIHWTKALFFRE